MSYFPGLMHFFCKISLKEIGKFMSNSPKYDTLASSRTFPTIIGWHCKLHYTLSVHFVLDAHSWAQKFWKSLTLWFMSTFMSILWEKCLLTYASRCAAVKSWSIITNIFFLQGSPYPKLARLLLHSAPLALIRLGGFGGCFPPLSVFCRTGWTL